MEDDEHTKLMLAHFENKRIEYATNYDRLGPAFASVPMEALHQDWLAAFRAWFILAAADTENHFHIRSDAALHLRELLSGAGLASPRSHPTAGAIQ
jgi:hypothetical protein